MPDYKKLYFELARKVSCATQILNEESFLAEKLLTETNRDTQKSSTGSLSQQTKSDC